jgi:hypothetical protein
MSGVVQTFVAGLIAIGLATAVLLPDRQTTQVIGATQKLLSGSLDTAIRG